jgi:Precorrin-3B methylase
MDKLVCPCKETYMKQPTRNRGKLAVWALTPEGLKKASIIVDSLKDAGGYGPGELCIVGIGPGALEYMSPKCRDALEKSHVVVGYKTYIVAVHGLKLEIGK